MLYVFAHGDVSILERDAAPYEELGGGGNARYPELFRIASDIGRKAGCFEIRKKDRTAFDDGDFDTEFHKRDGDFHAEKASPNHGSALSIASGSPDRVRIAFIVRGAPSVFKPTRTEF
jgi:hypothetical protein